MSRSWRLFLLDLIESAGKVRRNRIEDVYARYYERWVVERRAVIWHEG